MHSSHEATPAATNKSTFAAENQKNKQIVALVLSLPFRITGWWDMQNNITATWRFTLPKNFSAELSGTYNSGGLFGIYRVKSFQYVDFGLMKKLPKKSGTLNFSVSNILGPPIFKPSVDAPDRNLVTRARLRFAVTAFRLTYRKNFGNDKIKQKRNRSTGAEDAMERVQKN